MFIDTKSIQFFKKEKSYLVDKNLKSVFFFFLVKKWSISISTFCLVIDGGGLTGYECNVFRRLVFNKVDINMYISTFYALT